MWLRVVQGDMGWDRKQQGHAGGYYYRSKKVNGRCVKIYFGRGPLGELAALLDEHQREARLNQRVKLELADQQLKQARVLVDLLVAATLILNGYHQHHACWRWRR